jgi:hypothetical protein
MKIIDNKISILKEIIGSDYKTLKRKLAIYNIMNNTDYSLCDFGVTEKKSKNNIIEFYFYGKKINDSFTNKKFFTYIGSFHRANKWLDKRLESVKCVKKTNYEYVWETIYDNKLTIMVANNIFYKDNVDTQLSNHIINEFVDNNLIYNSTEAIYICKNYIFNKYGDCKEYYLKQEKD